MRALREEFFNGDWKVEADPFRPGILAIDERLLLEYAFYFLPAIQNALVDSVSKAALDQPTSSKPWEWTRRSSS